ncbi:MAG: FeoB-associated Cys-rich membrane protein [Eubacterium sp.]|nr:FeoB-associated Cys-rich membrane protein [Eubacterium sp.]
MIAFLSENIGTIIVLLILAGIVTAVVVKMVKDKKSGRSACGCNCSECGCGCNKCNE